MNILVIGLGSMGKRRIRILQEFYQDYNIIGIDKNAVRRQEIEDNYAIKCYSDIQAVIQNSKFHCAFVCTAPLDHAKIIYDCLSLDINVFTEINLISDGYVENINLAKEKGLTLFLSSTPLYRDEMKVITKKVALDNKPVNYIYHVGQYLPDWHPWEGYQQFFVGDKRTNGCREIMAIELPWMTRAFGAIKSVSAISGKCSELTIDYPDHYYISIYHQNGTKGLFAVDVLCRQAVRKLEVYNENLYIEWLGTPDSLKIKNNMTKELEKIECGSYLNLEGYNKFVNEMAYVNEIKEFFYVLNRNEKPEYGFYEDNVVLEWIDKIEGLS